MELRILETFAVFCLFLSIIRPLVRGLWKLNGLVICPLLAFAVLIGTFAAYGFRPECIPLLLFAFFLFLANLADLVALFSGLQNDIYRDRGLAFPIVSAVIFSFTLWLAFYFAPPIDMELSKQGVETLTVRDRDGEFCIRIYGDFEDAAEQDNELYAGGYELGVSLEGGLPPMEVSFGENGFAPSRPLLILLPPAAASLNVTEELCFALRDRGFTVLAYSRPGFDSPAFDRDGIPVRLSLPRLAHLISSFTRGMHNTAANARGRELEEGRRRDTELLLREVIENKTLQDRLGEGRNTVFLAGYGAGGAALTYLAGEDDFAARYPQVKGIIAIEAPLLSSLEGEIPPPPPPPSDDPIEILYREIKGFAESLLPKKITRIENIPRPVLPVMFVVSGRVIDNRYYRYETILRTLAASRNMALLAAVPGAGPFDYSGSPQYYPILSVLFRGAPYAVPSNEAIGAQFTASLISNFAAMVLSYNDEFSNDEFNNNDEFSIEKTGWDKNVYLEIGGVWRNPVSRAILQP